MVEMETNSKPTSFQLLQTVKKSQLALFVSVPSKNKVLKYIYDLKKEEKDPENTASIVKLKNQVGKTLGCHEGAVRGVVLS